MPFVLCAILYNYEEVQLCETGVYIFFVFLMGNDYEKCHSVYNNK
jgi:hypothetical protein